MSAKELRGFVARTTLISSRVCARPAGMVEAALKFAAVPDRTACDLQANVRNESKVDLHRRLLLAQSGLNCIAMLAQLRYHQLRHPRRGGSSGNCPMTGIAFSNRV